MNLRSLFCSVSLLAALPGIAAAAAPAANASRLDTAMQAMVQKYPELTRALEATSLKFHYSLSMAVTKDGRVISSGNTVLPEMPDLGLFGFDSSVATAIPDVGPGTARFPEGQPVGGAGKAARNIIASYLMLPADYDEARGIATVASAVREKHTAAMVPEVAILDSLPSMREVTRRVVANGGMPRLIAGQPVADLPIPPKGSQKLNLLTVFMSEDGKIARETIEQKSVEEMEAVLPLPVVEDSLGTRTAPYNAFNPPPVPPEAFKVLGLDAAQIGPTGYVIVYRTAGAQGMIQLLPGVVVRYAWPRRAGEPIGGNPSSSASR